MRTETLLDLLFENSEGLMGDMTVGVCLGHSDHGLGEFKNVGVRRKTVSRVATVNLKRPDFKLLGELASSVPWEFDLGGLGLHESSSLFKNRVLKAQEWVISLCLKRSKRGRRPAWLNRELCLELELKKKIW